MEGNTMDMKKLNMTNILSRIEEKKYTSAFFLGIISDFWMMLYNYAVNHDWIWLQAPLCFGIPFIGFLISKWFIDNPETSVRMKIVFWQACGNTIGTTLMLLFVRLFKIV